MDGYELVGWFTNQTDGEQIHDSNTIENDITFYAHWKEIEESE